MVVQMLRWQCDRLISLCLLPFLSICFFFLLQQLFYFLLFNLSKLCTCLISHLYYTILKDKTDRCNLIYNVKEKIRSWESIIRRLCLKHQFPLATWQWFWHMHDSLATHACEAACKLNCWADSAMEMWGSLELSTKHDRESSQWSCHSDNEM